MLRTLQTRDARTQRHALAFNGFIMTNEIGRLATLESADVAITALLVLDPASKYKAYSALRDTTTTSLQDRLRESLFQMEAEDCSNPEAKAHECSYTSRLRTSFEDGSLVIWAAQLAGPDAAVLEMWSEHSDLVRAIYNEHWNPPLPGTPLSKATKEETR